MRVIYISFYLILIFLSGCIGLEREKKHEAPKQLIELIEQINSNQGQKLDNGLLLKSCRLENGDSTFTYIIEVPDNRFQALSHDSVKAIITPDLNKDGKKKKIIRVLSAHNMGLQYEYVLPDSTVVKVYFSPDELKNQERNN